MNCICRGRTSFFRKRYTSGGRLALTRFTTVSVLNGTPWRCNICAAANTLSGRLAFFRDAVGVVKFRGTVEAESHQKTVSLEERAPLVI
jgi:hypothetical protein